MTSSPPLTMTPASILLVDDLPANLLALESILEPLGHRLVRATSGQEALACARDTDFAVVLMDVRLSGMSGVEATEKLRQAPRSHATPVIMLTAGDGDDDEILQAYAHGAVDYLRKPCLPQVLRSKVSVFVELFAAREECKQQALNLTAQRRAEQELAEGLVRERRYARHNALFGDVGLALTHNREQSAALQGCAVAMVRHLDAAFARIWVLNEDQQVLALRASAGLYTHLDGAHAAVPVGKFKIGLIAQERKPHLTNAVVGDARVGNQEWARREGMTAFAGYPLLVGDRLIGVMAMFARRPLPEDTLEALERVAESVALGIRRMAAEDEIRQFAQSLEQRVQERTAQLQEANRELESFSYSVSHDLRAPLRHITGFAQLLTTRAGSSLDEKSSGYIRTISDAAHKGGQLVDDLLSFSRMGRTELRTTRVSLARLMQDTQRELAPELHERRVEWRVAELPEVLGDPAMLRLVFDNLVDNALKYSRARPISVIEVGASEEAEEIHVWVKDNGVGFDMHHVDKLFGVFQRLHTADEFEGTGIGLANVRRIVNRHGGRAWAEGTVDGGATVHFTLPKEAPMSEKPAHGGSETRAAGRGQRQ